MNDGPRAPRRAPGDLEARVAKTNGAIRLLGLAIVFIALITGTKALTSGKNDAVANRPAVVYADQTLRSVLPQIAPTARYRYGAPADLAAKVAGGAKADVLLSTDAFGLAALAKRDECTKAVVFASIGGASGRAPATSATPSSPPAPGSAQGDDIVATTDDPTAPPSSPVASAGVTSYLYCVVVRDDANEAVVRAFIDRLTSIAGRDALLNAGYEIPATR